MKKENTSLMSEFYFKLEIQTENAQAIKYVLNEFDDIGIEEDGNRFSIYCQDELSQIDFLLQTFCKKMNIKYKSNMLKNKNEDWIKKYKENIKAIQIGEFYIHTSWQKEKENAINIQINPSLAFGTGHHYTTYSMIENISKYVKKSNTILDIGTGSGILSIVSSKLGAIVDCCDVDKDAITTTKENFKNNNTTFRDCFLGSIPNNPKIYDVVLANIISDVIISISQDINKATKKNSILILSGILTKYKDKVINSFKDFAIMTSLSSNDGEWTTLVLKKSR